MQPGDPGLPREKDGRPTGGRDRRSRQRGAQSGTEEQLAQLTEEEARLGGEE